MVFDKKSNEKRITELRNVITSIENKYNGDINNLNKKSNKFQHLRRKLNKSPSPILHAEVDRTKQFYNDYRKYVKSKKAIEKLKSEKAKSSYNHHLGIQSSSKESHQEKTVAQGREDSRSSKVCFDINKVITFNKGLECNCGIKETHKKLQYDEYQDASKGKGGNDRCNDKSDATMQRHGWKHKYPHHHHGSNEYIHKYNNLSEIEQFEYHSPNSIDVEECIDLDEENMNDEMSDEVLENVSDDGLSYDEGQSSNEDNNGNGIMNIEEDVIEDYNCCENCHRRYDERNEYMYGRVYLNAVRRNQIRQYKNLKFVTSSRTRDDTVLLCNECNKFLVTAETKESKKFKYTWPAFFWSIISDKTNTQIYGDYLWKFIPKNWRRWWIDEIKINNPTTYRNITLHKPTPFFTDKTDQCRLFTESIESLHLSRLISTINSDVMPDVLCPWGCTEFPHNCGKIEMDVLIQRFLKKREMFLPNGHAKMKYVNTCRDDYLRLGKYEPWLLDYQNSVVKPAFIFHELDGPVVCTCSNHNRGTTKFYLHPPRQPVHILPSATSDQLCHAVIKPRTVKPLKASKYYTTYQMHEQKGSFQGVDTCSITNYGDFSFTSVLLDQFENRSIAMRSDINALLNHLKKDEHLSTVTVEGMRQRAKTVYPDTSELDQFINGSTYVSFKDALVTQAELSVISSEVPVLLDVNGNGSNPTPYQSSPNWPKSIHVCQKNDKEKFGTPFPALRSFKYRGGVAEERPDTTLLWVVCGILCHNKEVWNIISSDTPIFAESNWKGWILTYCNFRFLDRLVSTTSKNNPFKMNKMSTTLDVVKKLDSFSIDDLSTLFNDDYKICYVDSVFQSEDTETIVQPHHRVVIIETNSKNFNMTKA